MAKEHPKKLRHEAHPSETRKGELFGLKDFARTKPFAVLAVLLVAVALLAAFFVGNNVQQSQDKALLAKDLYAENKADFNAYLTNIHERQAEPPQSTLDDDYLLSMQDDFEWLAAKNEGIYNSKPSTEVFPKTAAVYLFSLKITEINNDFTLDITQPKQTDYEARIAAAKKSAPAYTTFLTDEEKQAAFGSAQEEKVFEGQVKQLFDEYYSAKIQLLDSSDSLERKYVEAKKLMLLSYADDMNYPSAQDYPIDSNYL